jgi:uncharacterized protein (TIGR02284 family)
MAVSEKLINRLNDLLMLDHDAVDAYEQAIDRLKSVVCREKLREFQNDHRRHIVDLRKCIQDLEGVPKDRGDAKGFFIKGMTAIQSMMGDEMALKAMQTNERLTNKKYQEALDDQSIADDARLIVTRNRADEARHLDWINVALSQRIWESADTGAHP